MKYLTQKELIGVLKGLGLPLTEQRIISNRQNGRLPGPDVLASRPYPVKYYLPTVRKIIKIMSERRKIEVLEVDFQKVLAEAWSKRVFSY